MVRSSTVIVLGAGASKEVDLPTGAELKVKIADLLDFRFDSYRLVRGDPDIVDAFRQLEGGMHPYIEAGRQIRDALPLAKSIDDFLEVQKQDKTIGLCAKLAIVRAVLQSEARSSLYIDPRQSAQNLNFVALNDTWFAKFVRVLTESCSLAQLPERLRSFAFVVFNYDRCLEHFLIHAFRTFYRIGEDQAVSLVNGIDIFHPYGTVGYLPWQRRGSAIDFGGDLPESSMLTQLAAEIRTFSEGVQAGSDAAIKQKVKESNMLIFLGFAFHRINVDLLRPEFSPDERPVALAKVFATALRASVSDRKVIASALLQFRTIDAEVVRLEDMTCSQLFDEYQRTFALE